MGRRARPCYWVFAGMMVAASGLVLGAVSDPCDPGILISRDPGDKQSYRLRGDRCEGTYINRVSATGGADRRLGHGGKHGQRAASIWQDL